ncbi:LAFA_0A04588g1_1 [Lachancea sp. 'fantastica']|nr:LAFA_0A04588g1_1 [Lachancea sp. 'fantastica']
MTQGRGTETQGSSSVTISEPVPVLQLRGATNIRPTIGSNANQRNNVHWKEDVVDNEHLNKKKSKVCCIFHPQQNFEDTDANECDDHCHEHSSSSSSSSSESDAENSKKLDFESRRKARKERRHRKLQQKRSSSPNAYEFQPDYSNLRDKPGGSGSNASEAQQK